MDSSVPKSVASGEPGDDPVAIEIRITKLHQMFNSLDPSPFYEKELDKDAHEYIVDSVDEHHLQKPMKLVIQLPADQMHLAETAKLQDAIHNHFNYKLAEARRHMRFQMREGRIAFLIGFAFLIAIMSIRQLAFAFGRGTVSGILAEGLLILGWVAMWRPMQIFLYEWWPIRHHCQLYAKIAAMPVEVREAPPA
jgi:hypothetical protein